MFLEKNTYTHNSIGNNKNERLKTQKPHHIKIPLAIQWQKTGQGFGGPKIA